MPIPSITGTPLSHFDANGELPENFDYDSGSTGSDRCLVVSVTNESQSSDSITYNSVAMTKQVTVEDALSNEVTVWTLLNPSTGSNTISVTSSADPLDIAIHAACYQDVNQTTPVGATGSLIGVSSVDSDKVFTLTTTATDSKIITAGEMDGGFPLTEIGVVVGQTEVTENAGDSNLGRGFVTGVYDRDAATIQGYSVGMYVANTGKDYAIVGIELNAVGGTPPTFKPFWALHNSGIIGAGI